ncbi:MAG TPA: hypothetical protein PK357_00570 [Candidatus Pacearchaeota archaeon]|nr:hypothetical protein [Candidatus Pacearchaeota archaeon]
MTKLINPIERMVKRMIKKGEIKVLDKPEDLEMINITWNEIEKDMEEYKTMDNYRKGLSSIEPNKILIYQKIN